MMLPRRPALLALLAVLLLAGGGLAQPTSRPARPELFDPDRHIAVADVTPGMRGYGLTVFEGTTIEAFEIRVVAPLGRTQQLAGDMVLIECLDERLIESGPVQGMSGSPIYLQCPDGRDRLLGAFAIGWEFSKRPIIGVQPIESMLAIDADPPAEAVQNPNAKVGLPPTLRPGVVAALTDRSPAGAERRRTLLANEIGHATPLGLRDLLAPSADGGLPMLAIQDAATGAGGERPAAPPMEPGASLAVPLVTGDLEAAAIGTCTEVIGDRVFAFGHPLLDNGAGRVELPITGATIARVMPLQTASFKLGRVTEAVGTLYGDAPVGVAGTLGPAPAMAPVRLSVGPVESPRAVAFDVAHAPGTTPSLVIGTIVQSLGLDGSPDPTRALRWDLTLRFAGPDLDEPVEVRLRDAAALQESGTFGLLINLLSAVNGMLSVGDGTARLASIDGAIELVPADELPAANIVSATLDRAAYRAGETARISVVLERLDGVRDVRRIEMLLPSDLPPGEHALLVLPPQSAAAAEAESRPDLADANTPAELAAQYAFVLEYEPNTIHARLALPAAAVAVGDRLFRDLPPSRAALLVGAGASPDVRPVQPAVVAEASVPELVSGGGAEIVLRVLP